MDPVASKHRFVIQPNIGYIKRAHILKLDFIGLKCSASHRVPRNPARN